MEKKPNLILITIDDLRADFVGFLNSQKNITPNLDKLAKESLIFKNAFSVGPMTPHSFPAILTSTYPLDFHGPKKIERPRILISEVFQNQGYITAAFHSNPYLSGFFGYDKGWDYFEYLRLEGKRNKILEDFKSFLEKISKKLVNWNPKFVFQIRYLFYKLGIWKPFKKILAFEINKLLKEFLLANKNSEKPFFIWVHYMDVHYPFMFFDHYFKDLPLSLSDLIARSLPTFLTRRESLSLPLKKFAFQNMNLVKRAYEDGIRYLDLQIGNLIDFLKKENLFENTIICLTSDHGEEFLEHGGANHDAKLYQELLKVPLLIKFPRGEKKGIFEEKVSLIDLAPTLCDIVKVKTPPSFKGKSFFKEKRKIIFHQTGENKKEKNREFAFLNIESLEQCKMAVQFENFKYILDFDKKGEELYDLKKDPKEKENIFSKRQDVALKARKLIEKFLKENLPLKIKC